MVDVIAVEPFPLGDGAIDYYPMDKKDLEWLRQCRTRIPEVAHIITFIINYIFSDTLCLKREVPVAASTNWRGIGARILEMLLVYGFVFVSFDENDREIRVWEPSELEITYRKTALGRFTFKARVNDAFRRGMEDLQPTLLALVYQYPENGRPMSTLSPLRSFLESLNPLMMAGFVATMRGANPTAFIHADASSQLDVAGRDLYQQGEQERLLREAEEAAHRREMMFVHKTHAAQAMTNSAVVAALTANDESSALPLSEVAARVLQGSLKIPMMVMPQNMTVAKGPEPHIDVKFIELAVQRARHIIAESFSVPAAIFNVDSKFVTSSVAGISFHMMETTIDHYMALISESVDKIVYYLVDDKGDVKEKKKRTDPIYSVAKGSRRDVHILSIVRRRPITEVLSLKTELKRDAYIRLLAASTGMEEEDFDPVDRELQLQVAGVDPDSQLGSSAIKKLDGFNKGV